MARLVTAGFESQIQSTTAVNHGETDNNGQAFTQVGSPTFDTTNPRSGLACLSCPQNANNYIQAANIVSVLDRHYYLRGAFRFTDATPAASIPVLTLIANAITVGFVRLGTNGKLDLVEANGTQVGVSSATLADNTWYLIEMHIVIPTAGNGTLEAKLDGLQFAGSSSVDVNNSVTNGNARWGHVTANTSNSTVLVDDIAVNDDQGANQASWCADGQVVVCKPTADTATRNSWVGGAGATTNLFAAIDNAPPLGVAVGGSSTDSTQIENTVSATTETYEVTCQSYTAAGVPSTAAITLVQALARGGNSTTTSRNKGVVGVSNPAISEVTNATGTTAAGTEPTGWRSHRTAIAYAPSVTLGTGPVVRVRKATASTDALTFDQVGLLVEFKPVIPLAGQADGTSTATGDLSVAHPLAGSSAGTATATATLSDTSVRVFDGSGDYVEVSQGSVSPNFNNGGGWTLLVLAKPTLGNTLCLIAFGQSGGGTTASIYLASDGEVRIGTDNPGFNGLSSLHADNGDWQLFAVTQSAGNGTPRLHRRDDAGGWTHANNSTGTMGTNTTGALLNYFGRFRNGGGDFLGAMAMGAYWPRGLSDADLEAITDTSQSVYDAPGGSPTALWELGGATVEDVIGAADQASISGTTADIEDVGWTYGVTVSGSAQALAGTVAGTGTATGALAVARPLAGQSDGAGTATGALTVAHPLAGQSDGVGTATGELTISRPLAAQANGTSTATGDLTAAHPLAGAAAGVGTATGALAVAHPLAGQADGAGTATGELTISRPLAGSSAGTGTVTGDLTVPHPLDGTAAGIGTATGDLTVVHPLAGSSAGSSTATGDLTVAHPLAGQSNGVGTATGDMSGTIVLAGIAAGSSTVTGAIRVAFTLAGTASGTATATGDVSVTLGLAGTSAGTSTTTGNLTAARPLAGQSAGTGAASGNLTAIRPLAGSVSGTSTAAGNLAVGRPLAAQVNATSTTTGDLSTILGLAGVAAGVGTIEGDMATRVALDGAAAGGSTATAALSVFAPDGRSGWFESSVTLAGLAVESDISMNGIPLESDIDLSR